jgi:hypothetical protein
MLNSRSVGLRCVVLSMIFGLLLPSLPLLADDAPPDLPPPPESGDTGLTPIDGASAGAELPPPPIPGAPEAPTSSASAADTPPPTDATAVATPAGEEIPALPLEGDPKDQAASSDAPQDTGLSDVPSSSPDMMAASPEFSSSSELKNVSMKDRVNSKNLVLWLSLGPSYGTLTNKGSYATATSTVAGGTDAVGGLGYNAGIGFMLDNTFQLQFDFTGTPKTKSSTVDQAMFGFGPRLGFLTLMGTFGVQAGPDPTAGNGLSQIFAIGARAGLDLILKHGSDSRTSIGLAPEVYFITPQGADGYNSAGISVSLRIYGYYNAF